MFARDELKTHNSELKTDETGCGGRIRTFADRINSAVPYRLATPQKWWREQELNLPVLAYETTEPPLLYPRVKTVCKLPRHLFAVLLASVCRPQSAAIFGGDEGSRTLIVRFTRPLLCLSN
jgi:hypothetical protein